MILRICFFVFFCSSYIGFAQVSKTDLLYKSIRNLDRKIFVEGFNQCDFSSYDSIISEDLEFYHDVGGATLGKENWIDSMKNNICKNPEKPQRILKEKTLKVYPLFNNKQLYGAIEEGTHYFTILQNNKKIKTGSAKFSILWILENEQWKMKRVFSFDHQALK